MTFLTAAPRRRAFSILLASVLLPAAVLAQAPASTETVQLRDIELTYPAEAVVEAVRQATVAAQVQGRVVEVRVDAGVRVKQGETLMRIDAREAAQGVASAQAQLSQAKAQYERTKSLVERKFMSASALDQAEAAYKSAQASAGASGASLSHAVVVAPISGIVSQRHAEIGELAAPGRPLLTLFDPKGLRVIASVPQFKLSDVRKMATAKVEFPESGRWIDAVRVEILPAADPRSHTVTARLYLPDNLEGVIPGMAARAHFVTGQGAKLTVPATAILRRGEVTAVYVMDGKAGAGQARLRQVRLGEAVAGGRVEVLAGIKPGDNVALDPVKAGIELKQQAPAKK
ncbi:MAG: efflux RND transporter periplasmic adaptor subunit [Gammaproteobacteria bacterium]|nr:efflux RND transporter periplasmic adaptor subunit [Gammaproteobacteria bacterium]MBU1646948.1 efflux RND transporter periplasmic adaptor subunit [Gammaproteobacteria bacterium]MBU1972460.1 efflux RND transporter periplasmic adaptor subunit [Gammaproteobacteria bacterium]